MRIEAGRLIIEADSMGRLSSVAPRRRPDRSFLDAVDIGACRRSGVDVSWAEPEVEIDTDEVAVRRRSAGLELTVRHSFSTGWTTRLLLVNTGSTDYRLDRISLVVRPAAGHRVSAQAAGSRLCWAAQATDGEGPVLAARLAAGAVDLVTGDALELGPLRLAAGQRYVAQLRWELFATPRSVVVGPGRDVLVERTTYEVGESVQLPADPDAALVTPPGVAVDVVEEVEHAGREVFAVEPGHHRVELRSADGDVRLDLSWVYPLADQLSRWASDVLGGPRTPAGIVALETLPDALVLQAALGAGDVDDDDQAGDALDRLTARLTDEVSGEGAAVSTNPLSVLYLLGEHGRTGDDDVLAAALDREGQLLAIHGPPLPGLGLAVLRTVLAVGGTGAQERLPPLLRRAVLRVERLPPAGDGADQAAELELLLAVRPLLPDDHPAHQRLLTLVRALGAALGSGLPGRLLTPPPVAEHAHLVAVLRMLPEQGSAEPGLVGVTRSWGAPPSLLAHRQTLELLDRLTGPAAADPWSAGRADGGRVGPAAAWLALVPRHG
ncbi:MAG TPA: hypothetical protein VIT65_08020 [Microlunatus sp.]